MTVSVPVTEGLFTTEGETRLLGSRCRSCGGHHFPRHTTCPYCSSDEVEPADLSTAGTLWAWTSVTAPPPGYGGVVPFGFGVVELPEGLRVITLLTESDPARLHAGQPMRITVLDLERSTADDGSATVVRTYAFEPA